MPGREQLSVRRFSPSEEEAFWRVHAVKHRCGWCACVAWWVPTWEAWGERTAEENRVLRTDLIDQGEYDGYLLFAGDQPVGWCQAGVRDRLPKLVSQYRLDRDPETWALTCFLIHPHKRGRGLASKLLEEVLEDLAGRGVRRVEAYPQRGEALSSRELWKGPEAIYLQAGFKVVRDDARNPILALELAP